MTEQRASQESSRDPFELWRQFYEQNEQAWTKSMKELMATQGFAEAQGKLLETFLTYQKMMRDAMSSQLSNLNIPTRDDVSRLGELIVNLEDKVDQLDDRLARMEDFLTQQGEEGAESGQERGGRSRGGSARQGGRKPAAEEK